MNLNKNPLFPGQCVSDDHFVSAIPGCLSSLKDGTPEHKKCHGGTIFVDHTSGYLFVNPQVSLSATDTLTNSITTQSYHTSNGAFNGEEFLSKLHHMEQDLGLVVLVQDFKMLLLNGQFMLLSHWLALC